MRNAALFLVLMLGGCPTGLRPTNEDSDTGPPDTGEEIDSGNHDGNTAPVADAGDDDDAMVGDVVHLDGSGSYDPDGDQVTYSWELTDVPTGSLASLINETWSDPEFWADAEGVYVIELEVSDGIAIDVDEVRITVENNNNAPVADAGADQYVTQGDTVQLNGGSSWDPEGDALNFAWEITTRPTGSGAALNDPSSPLPRFTADAVGEYQIRLVVDDGEYTSSPDVVRVVAQSAGSDDDCLSCAAVVQDEAGRRWSMGELASGPGLLLLPLVVLFWHRGRRREDEDQVPPTQ